MLCLLMSCAGPYSPFGAINAGTNNFGQILKQSNQSQEELVRVYPKFQNIHRNHDLTIVLDNYTDKSKFNVFYNGIEITESFISSSFIRYGKNKKIIQYSSLNLPSNTVHDIYFKYQPHDNQFPIIVEWEKPKCTHNKISRDMKHNNELIQMVNDLSNPNYMNPNYILGIIAEESLFNPKAVSENKSIGLTQISPLAENYITKTHKSWPQYPSINQYNSLKIKTLIEIEEIHKHNEWRLNEELSIKGAITYIHRIRDYWNKPENNKIVKSIFKEQVPIDEIILASYKSGPLRVKKQLHLYGKRWRESRDLREANLYIRKVNSYCAAFDESTESEAQYFANLNLYKNR